MPKEAEFHRKKLDNGLTVIFEKRSGPVVAISSSVKFGAQYESQGIKGISHFIEHLVFKGTKKRNVKEIAEAIEGRGGIINAFTGEELTCFWNKLPKKHFSLGADVSRDLILNPLFEKKDLERERKVVLEEIKMFHDNPTTYVLEKTKERLFETPFNIPITGSLKSVADLSRKKIVDLFNSVYSTNNMIFSVVGNVEWKDVLEEGQRFPKVSKEIRQIPIVLKNGELIEKRRGIDQAHLVLGFHMPRLIDKNRYAAEVFDSILGGGMSSRLFQEIREKRGLCYVIKSNLEQSRDYSYLVVYSGALKQNVRKIKEIVLKEIRKIKELKQRELSEAKERLIGLKEISKEKCDLTMIELLCEEIAGDAGRYYKYGEEVNKINLKEVKELSKLRGYSFVALLPD